MGGVWRTAGPRRHSGAGRARLLQAGRSIAPSRYDAPVRPGFLDPGGSLDAALREVPALAERLRALPWPAALGLAGLGLTILAVGARWRRPLAVCGGAVLGWTAGVALAPWLLREVGVSPLATRAIAATALAVLSGFVPSAFLFAAGALPGAVVGSLLSAEPASLWAGLGLGGLAGLVAGRAVAAMAAAAFGAMLLAAAALAVSDHVDSFRALAERPFVLLTLTAVVAVAGAAFQWARAWEPPAPRPEHAISEPAPDQAETRLE